MSSLKVKMIAPLVIGVALLTCSLSWYTYTSARHAMERAVLMVAKTETGRVKNAMSFFLKSNMATLQNLVIDQHVLEVFNRVDSETLQSTERWLQTLIQGNEFYRDISILSNTGKCIASSNPSQVGIYFTDKPCVQRALEGQFSFADPTMGQVSRKLTLSVAGPINVDGLIGGVLQVVSDFPGFVSYSADDGEDDTRVFTSILARDGSFVAHKNHLILDASERFSELYNMFSKRENQGRLISFQLHEEQFIGFAQIEPASKWIVLTSGLAKEVFASAYHVGLVVLGVSILTLLVISFFIMRFAQGILDTLFALISFAKRVSQGDLSLQLEDAPRSDELGELHVSLQRLVVSLRSMLEQTEEASKLKGQFLANMSHEIRTPINAILGISHLSLRDKEISDKQRSNLDKIQVAAKSLLGVINDILDISKVEAGRLEFDETPFDILDTVRNALVIQQINATGKGLLLNFHYEEGTPERFLGDPMRIGQVLNNLLSNAVKFTKEGSITVTCWQDKDAPDLVEPEENGVVETRPTVFIRIAVTDTGMGMSEETRSILFQPFTQADASITRQFGGTGLGLAISRSIARLMRGDLTVASALGEGSTFEFSMRLVLDSTTPQQREELSQEMDFGKLDLSQKRILIAEDNEINQLILQEMLAPANPILVTVGNGKLAVEAVQVNNFDIALMDMQMPIMDGLQATKTIRETHSQERLPIIAVTANAMLEDKNKGHEVGMNAYLTKPIDPAELFRTLKYWLVDKA